jgi:hypothetical protein
MDDGGASRATLARRFSSQAPVRRFFDGRPRIEILGCASADARVGLPVVGSSAQRAVRLPSWRSERKRANDVRMAVGGLAAYEGPPRCSCARRGRCVVRETVSPVRRGAVVTTVAQTLGLGIGAVIQRGARPPTRSGCRAPRT